MSDEPTRNGRPFDNGKIGDMVFDVTTLGLAAEMRRVALPAIDHYREHAEHARFLERRAVIVAYQGRVGVTAALLAADQCLERYHAERAGTLDLADMGFDGKPEAFLGWWEEALGIGHFESGADFLRVAASRTKWVTRTDRPAVDHVTAERTPNGQSGYCSASDQELGIMTPASIDESPVKWLWPYRLAEGEMALLAGDGGLGKSNLLLAIAAMITCGQEWPDRSGYAPVGSVAIVSAEDSRETMLKPRLMALGADLTRIRFVTAKVTIRKPNEQPTVNPMTLADRPYWREVLKRIPGCRMLIIDPIPSYLGRGVNDSKNSELRSIIEPFIDEVIRPANVCFVANTHLNKTVDAKSPLHRITGSMAYGALPRNVHLVVRDPQRPERRLFVQAKCNAAPDNLQAVAFRLETVVISSAKGDIETSRPVFEQETVDVDLAEAMGGKANRRGPTPEKTMKVARWLLDYLRGQVGAVPFRDVINAAGDNGFAGELRPDREGRTRWSNPRMLYKAKDAVRALDGPDSGWMIEDVKCGNVTAWQAVKAEESLVYADNCKHSKPPCF